MTKTKRNIFLGLGAIAAVTTPVVAVVACGSSSDSSTPTQGSGHIANLTGSKFMDDVTAPTVKTFLEAVMTTGNDPDGGVFVVKSGLSKADYDAAATATGKKDYFDDILALNKNDPTLASYVINFTYKTITGVALSYMGLKDMNDVSLQAKADAEIKSGTLDAKSIADSIMNKFTDVGTTGTAQSKDPIWGPAIFLTYKNVGGTLTLNSPGLETTMGGAESVKAIVTSAGYQYA